MITISICIQYYFIHVQGRIKIREDTLVKYSNPGGQLGTAGGAGAQDKGTGTEGA